MKMKVNIWGVNIFLYNGLFSSSSFLVLDLLGPFSSISSPSPPASADFLNAVHFRRGLTSFVIDGGQLRAKNGF